MDVPYLRSAIINHPHRPILHHLNADTSWLLQLPIPDSHLAGGSGRKYYNILIDPWLSGSQSDVASWFSQQWHAIPSAYQSINDIQDLCLTAETLSSVSGSSTSITSGSGGASKAKEGENYIDAVAISHEFTDHCHKQTLMEVPRSTPVYAWSKAAGLIKGFKWFDRVVEIPAFTKDWRETSVDPLPSWLGIGRLFNESDGLYYHAALTFTFLLAPTSSPEVIIYTPHGLHAPTLTPIPLSSPPVTPLCLLHGLHDVHLDWRQQLNLGAHHALAAQRMLGAKYWMGTHDEEKTGKGVVSWFLRRKKYSVQEAVQEEMRRVEEEAEKSGAVSETEWEEKSREWRGTGWREIGNGEAVVLREDGK